ncbi:TerC family protein [Phocoenobacter skyensis]|uniref:Membrane protein TerC, possibly involved in tellurium resistance n=1 Tax=Phocoenobacter skyensis TaxID=97481 RepID=A0A1H7Z7F6_9PAST|nr:TerC family protein [Pasteurella skyensis]MDP8079565.1 TerC family protein [Pasteurella skyensis]MDP8085437.1 TerC family protein [Pasteurella skyensis]MDP8162252.1 TerC family protein [Pasteurella skyensis]MDP8171381.1 TerC family protein [Pasteurella skyensis]MDP8172716.1 TerC family protein [Pasteurella skyensis]
MFEWMSNPEAWIALLTLSTLEIVLGIDNIIVITILVSKLPQHQHRSARILGLGLAMLTRILLLLTLAWMIRLVEPLFSVLGKGISGRDLILILGGLFLIIKSISELKEAVSGNTHHNNISPKAKTSNYVITLVQIAIIDIVFSLDSVITAVGMANDIPVMVLAIMIAVGIMMLAANTIGDFVDRHPTIKNLALAFLVLIGFALIAEGFNIHIPKVAIYTAMGFSVVVELLNIQMKKNIEKYQHRD